MNRIALHEAAHAVIAAAVGLPCEMVTLVPKEGSLAFMRHSQSTARALRAAHAGDRRFAHLARADAVVALAGAAVELVVFNASTGAHVDIACAKRLARACGASLRELALEAEMRVRSRFRTIQRVAFALERDGTLSGAAVAKIAGSRRRAPRRRGNEALCFPLAFHSGLWRELAEGPLSGVEAERRGLVLSVGDGMIARLAKVL